MTRQLLLGSELKQLLSGVSVHGANHLTEVETDLGQTSFLLGEAIQKLAASFMAIHASVCAQQDTVDLLLSGRPLTPELTENLKAKQGEISQHVNAAVTGLQFQDMTSQLIERTVRRVSGLRDVLCALSVSEAALTSEGDLDEMIAVLQELNTLFHEKSTMLEGALWKAVAQTHMESGDIELF